MLSNLDNEVYFKNVFTDVEVFSEFVKDVLGLEINIKKVETEKVLTDAVSAIKFRMDLFAEDQDSRAIIEIQKVDYDYNYDRFAHYFIGNLIDMQRSSKNYAFKKDVYVIVVVTSAYRITDKNKEPIKDGVLVTDINPRNLKGEIRYMNDHKMVILNTTCRDKDTPDRIKDWLDLIAESMDNPEYPKINISKKGIAKAAELANMNNLTPEQLADAKIQEMKKITLAIVEDRGVEKGRRLGKKEGIDEGIKLQKDTGIIKALKRGKLTVEEIAEDFEVDVEYVEKLKASL